MARLIPDQMSKWFNTTYGFIMGIAAAALSIGVISAATVGIGIGSMALFVYLNSHALTNKCIDNTKKEFREKEGISSYEGVYVTLISVNKCRKKNGLSTLTEKEVKNGKKYPSTLDYLWQE